MYTNQDSNLVRARMIANYEDSVVLSIGDVGFFVLKSEIEKRDTKRYLKDDVVGGHVFICTVLKSNPRKYVLVPSTMKARLEINIASRRKKTE